MKSALVFGATRGIGREIALRLCRDGYAVGVAAKTVTDSPKLPGTIYTVCEEIKKLGGVALPIHCDVRVDSNVSDAIRSCINQFGHLDAVVYNTGAVWWDTVAKTPLKRFDLLWQVNVRGSYCAVQEVLPHMLARKHGRIVLVAPPIYSRFFQGKTAYSISKVGMTVLTSGLANELKGTGVSISTLWPATVIKSHVTEVKDTPLNVMRTPAIFADATLHILNEATDKFNGQALIDEDLLRTCGETDFIKYRCDPNIEPPRMMPAKFPSLTVEEELKKTFEAKL